MINLVTRPTRPGEKDLLIGGEELPLFIKPLSFIDPVPATICINSPTGGWTHDRLEAAAMSVEVENFLIRNSGADAYLGDDWIGSTEI